MKEAYKKEMFGNFWVIWGNFSQNIWSHYAFPANQSRAIFLIA